MEAINVRKDAATRRGRGKLLTILLAILLVAAIVVAGVVYHKYDQLKKNPNAAADKETTSLINQVGKLMSLPSGETPTVATVQDKSKLKGQAFFASAQNGDKLLIYTSAKKAIIYRPSSNKIINVGPIAIDSGSTSTTGTSTDTK